MSLKLKRLRLEANLTQARLAKTAGVTQPTYQRWETGRSAIPTEKLQLLAVALDTTEATILGQHAPVEAAFHDPDAPEHLQYYGEVAIHFVGGGEPILLSISEKSHSDLYRDLQGNARFVVVESLSNQTVIVRVDAISDLYFSSEAYDYFGPKGEKYDFYSPLHLPDPRDWEIIEAIACDGVGLEDFDEANIQHIEEILRLTTDEEFSQLADSNSIDRDQIPVLKEQEEKKAEFIASLATNVTYQLSDGKRRNVFADSDAVYEAFWMLIESSDLYEDEIIRLPVEGYHRTIFINPNSIDYTSIPTHKWEAGSVKAAIEPAPSSNKRPQRKLRHRGT
ncbi:helix-turn-helix domain-containing protein [Aquamicrobium terrae]|uniref:Transcriptional regulator with XRE-family HTH domain n=1 Tax=Aquamicrobium terrae TaxID=1324945 RepID=A0ABV2N0C0_9HYPH